MSGGSYHYSYFHIEELSEKLSERMEDEFTPIRDRMSVALKQVAKQCYDIEWTDSADYGEETWVTIEKWLAKHNF